MTAGDAGSGPGKNGKKAPHEAMLWAADADSGNVRCGLCRHECTITEGKLGRCQVRRNVGGKLVTLTYGKLIAAAVDPIEKKPLYHVSPGSKSMSVASVGCNFRCKFCQNWQISQISGDADSARYDDVNPGDVVTSALSHKCRSISYTYTEPTVFFEFAYDTAIEAKKAGIINCFVSNGFMSPSAIERISPYLDAANIDLKAFKESTYSDVMGGRLSGVLDSLKALHENGVWLEVTTLIVPGMNDSAAELADIAKFIAGELSAEVPWHISRYHDSYKYDSRGRTPEYKLAEAAKIGRDAGLNNVYLGNVAASEAGNTYCPNCGELLIERSYMGLKRNSLSDGKCCKCSHKIAGIW